MQDFAATAMAVAMIAGFLLVGVGVKLALAPANRKRGLLMIAAAAVLFANVAVWTV